MKFILNEGTKFLLEERFILTEASVADAIKDWIEELQNNFESTETVIQAYYTYAGGTKTSLRVQKFVQNFTKATEELTTSLERPFAKVTAEAEFNKIKTELNSYIQLLKQISTVIEETEETQSIFAVLEARTIKALEQLVTKSPWIEADVTQVKKYISQIDTQILPLLTSKSGVNEDSLKGLKKDCEKCATFIDTLKKYLAKSFDFTHTTKDEFSAFKSAASTAITAATSIPQYKNILAATTKKDEKDLKSLVIQGTSTAGAAIQALIKAYAQLKDTDVIKDMLASDGLDWKSKLAKAVNKSAIIEAFIYDTWPESAQFTEVLKIKNTLLLECEAYGFNQEGEAANPFLQFISNVYLKYKIKPEIYNVIHNLVVDHQLSSEDLMGAGLMENTNLIFCKALYQLPADDIKLYVRKQYSILKAKAKPESFTNNAEMAYNILYDLPEIVTTNAINSTSEALTLRPLQEVERLEAKWTGVVSDTREKNKPKSTASNEAILNQISTRDDAIKTITALAIKFSSNKKIIEEVNKCIEAKQLLNGSTTPAELIKLVASVEKHYGMEEIKAAQALALITEIINSEKFNLTRE